MICKKSTKSNHVYISRDIEQDTDTCAALCLEGGLCSDGFYMIYYLVMEHGTHTIWPDGPP